MRWDTAKRMNPGVTEEYQQVKKTGLQNSPAVREGGGGHWCSRHPKAFQRPG